MNAGFQWVIKLLRNHLSRPWEFGVFFSYRSLAIKTVLHRFGADNIRCKIKNQRCYKKAVDIVPHINWKSQWFSFREMHIEHYSMCKRSSLQPKEMTVIPEGCRKDLGAKLSCHLNLAWFLSNTRWLFASAVAILSSLWMNGETIPSIFYQI
jgi:hypothetical protein